MDTPLRVGPVPSIHRESDKYPMSIESGDQYPVFIEGGISTLCPQQGFVLC
jgi:hypothetical protein